MKLAQVSVILARIETFSDDSAAIERCFDYLLMYALRERCGCSVQRLRSSLILFLSLSLFHSLVRLCGGLRSLSFAVIKLARVSLVMADVVVF